MNFYYNFINQLEVVQSEIKTKIIQFQLLIHFSELARLWK